MHGDNAGAGQKSESWNLSSMDSLLYGAAGFGLRITARPIIQYPEPQVFVGDRAHLVLRQ